MHDYENYKFYINGKIIDLTDTENELIYLFLANRNRLVTRNMICQRLYAENYKEYQKCSISRNIKKLREKFGLHIITMSGRGYCLRDGISERG